MQKTHYKSYSFRLNERTIEKIRELYKKNAFKSYNLLFLNMTRNYRISRIKTITSKAILSEQNNKGDKQQEVQNEE